MPEVKTYNAALSVVARSGREDVALALLRQMEIDGEDGSGIAGKRVLMTAAFYFPRSMK